MGMLDRLLTFRNPLRNYEILETLGKGGEAEIYKARHKKEGYIVAIKILHAASSRKRDLVADALNEPQVEGEIAMRLDHPNIIRTYDFGRFRDNYYFVMEYFEGVTLDRRLDRGDLLVEQRAFHIMLQIAEGLDYLHHVGIIHRDICPRNIIVSDDAVAKILDFGLAIFKRGRYKRVGEKAGTPSYMSPEQVRGAEVDERSDIYSLGATYYRMLTGSPPFKGASPVETMQMHINAPLIPPRALDPDIVPEMEAIILKAMRPDPAERYQSVRDLIADLRNVGVPKKKRNDAAEDTP